MDSALEPIWPLPAAIEEIASLAETIHRRNG